VLPNRRVPETGNSAEKKNEESEYEHSSAKYYTIGEQGVYSVTNYTHLEDIDLTKAL
jgi:hypothetical protein